MIVDQSSIVKRHGEPGPVGAWVVRGEVPPNGKCLIVRLFRRGEASCLTEDLPQIVQYQCDDGPMRAWITCCELAPDGQGFPIRLLGFGVTTAIIPNQP